MKETLTATLERSTRRFGDAPLFGRRRDGAWVYATYREFSAEVHDLAYGLHDTGVGPGDRVAILSGNRREWAAVAYASYALGAIVVPLFPALGPQQWTHILADSGASVLFCANQPLYVRAQRMAAQLETLRHVFAFDLEPDHPAAYAGLLRRGRTRPAATIKVEAGDTTDAERTATLLYTSGTGGRPKGAMITHHNVCANVASMLAAMPLSGRDRTLSFLPWAHAFGHTCELHGMIRLGGSIAVSSSVDRLMLELNQVRPSVLVSVPRLFIRLYERVQREIQGRPQLIRRLFEHGLALRRKQRTGHLGKAERLALQTADRTVFGPIRSRLGGNLRYAFSGGAALSTEVATFIADIGLTVYEGYGLTEAGPVVSANRPGVFRLGSVGKPLGGVRVRIEDGELVVYGASVMKGYFRRPEETRIAIADDGGLHTGDLGHFDEDGFLFITGRRDAQYRLDSGLDVLPAPLEEQMAMSPYIRHAMVHGAGRGHNVALVSVDLDALARWCEPRDLSFSDTRAMLESPRVRRHILAEIGERTPYARPHERVRAVALIADDFTPENGLLTATLKLRRGEVTRRYRHVLEALYAR
ncbi:MAG: long-chain fatty acid--CoA ligase [Myxococcota bacterium]